MIRKLPVFLICLCITASVFAQTDSTSLLYEISGNGLTKKSYVFGTIHLQDKRVFGQVNDKSDSFWVCFNNADIIAGELVMDKKEIKDDLDPQDVLLPDGVTLAGLLSPEDYAKVKSYAQEHLGWKAIAIDKMQPFFTAALITEDMAASDYKTSLDEYLQKEGKKKKKQIIGLETVKEQLAALSTVPIEDQAKDLVKLVDSPDVARQQLNRMIELYSTRNLIEITEFMKSSDLDPEMEEAFLTKRNHVMVDRIDKLIRENSVFIAIGTGHLPGEEGVLKLLKDKGYSVRPVR